MATGTPAAPQPAGGARLTILSLLGSQLDELGGELWLATLLALLAPLGLSESAARAQLQRMAAAGWFEVDRIGRHSRYRLTGRARDELRSGDRRVLETSEPTEPGWDGTWTVVCYEIDEGRRTSRDRLRAELQWLGFGALQAGVWISPGRLGPAAHALRTRLGLRNRVQVAEGATFPADEHAALVRRCWDLEAITHRWEAVDRLLDAADGPPAGDEAAYVADQALLAGLLDALRADPNLPEALLPPSWSGTAVRRRVEARRAALRPAVRRHVQAVLAATSPAS
ncbi:MAG: PaaX family transcriptional regulator C-terminal domain-containing protein [Acidimicrobiia bacterium]